MTQETSEQAEPTERAKELGRTYAAQCVSAIEKHLAKGSSPLYALLDWGRIMEPVAEIAAQRLTAEELEQAIAWQESQLCQKLMDLQGPIQAAVQIGIERLMKEKMGW